MSIKQGRSSKKTQAREEKRRASHLHSLRQCAGLLDIKPWHGMHRINLRTMLAVHGLHDADNPALSSEQMVECAVAFLDGAPAAWVNSYARTLDGSRS